MSRSVMLPVILYFCLFVNAFVSSSRPVSKSCVEPGDPMGLPVALTLRALRQIYNTIQEPEVIDQLEKIFQRVVTAQDKAISCFMSNSDVVTSHTDGLLKFITQKGRDALGLRPDEDILNGIATLDGPLKMMYLATDPDIRRQIKSLANEMTTVTEDAMKCYAMTLTPVMPQIFSLMAKFSFIGDVVYCLGVNY